MTAVVLLALGSVIALGVVVLVRPAFGCWLVGWWHDLTMMDGRKIRDRRTYRRWNPMGWPPEGHLCLACLRYYAALAPPDHTVCAGCLLDSNAESEVSADDS